ncbi:MAG: hypothetical protein Q7R54_00755 [bacterium]|nr:hypothetical protein [bacterium]
METIGPVFAVVGVLVLIAIAALAIILLLAKLEAYFTTIDQGAIKTIDTGESLSAIWPNVDGYKMSEQEDLEGHKWLVRSKGKDDEMDAFFGDASFRPFQEWLWKRFGVRFISIFWPQVSVHWFDIRSRLHLDDGVTLELGTPLKKRITPSREPTTVVNSLLFTVPRPVYLGGVELAGDNSKIDLLLLPVYRAVIPSLSIYNLRGDFFTQLDAALEAVMVDFAASHRVAVFKPTKRNNKGGQFAGDFYPQTADEKTRFKEWYGVDAKAVEASYLTYAFWLKLAKAGERSAIERHLHHLNLSEEYCQKLSNNGKTELADYALELTQEPIKKVAGDLSRLIPTGIVPRFGFALVSFRVVDWEANGKTAELAVALLAKETKFHTAEGVRAEAAGVRDAIRARTDGESYRFKELVKALIEETGVDSNIAAQVVQEQIRMENIRDSKLTTYVEGGSRTSVMIPAGTPPKEKELLP